MKRVRINEGRVGLIFRNGDFKGVLTEGVHWTNIFNKILIYNTQAMFAPPVELNILLKNEDMKNLLHVIEIADNEIGIQYKDGNFYAVLNPGKYAFWKSINEFTFLIADTSEPTITEEISRSVLKRREFIPYVVTCTISSFENGLLFIDNKLDSVLSPGTYYFWKAAKEVTVSKIDLRSVQMEVSGQEILTKDKAAIRINFFTIYKVVDILKAISANKDYEKQLYILVQFALREFISSLSLDELLESKEKIAEYVMDVLKAKALALGVALSDCGVKDIILPGEMKEIMNHVLVAQKQAQANVIVRREETATTRSMLNTAKLMEDNTMLFKLKEMEYVEKIADKIGEITVSGNGQVLNQLRDIFSSK